MAKLSFSNSHIRTLSRLSQSFSLSLSLSLSLSHSLSAYLHLFSSILNLSNVIFIHSLLLIQMTQPLFPDSVQKRQTALTLEVAGIRCVVVSPSPVSEVVDNSNDDDFQTDKQVTSVLIWIRPNQATLVDLKESLNNSRTKTSHKAQMSCFLTYLGGLYWKIFIHQVLRKRFEVLKYWELSPGPLSNDPTKTRPPSSQPKHGLFRLSVHLSLSVLTTVRYGSEWSKSGRN